MYNIHPDAKPELSRRGYRGKQWTTRQPKPKYLRNAANQASDGRYRFVSICLDAQQL